jgi:hypothetical protein
MGAQEILIVKKTDICELFVAHFTQEIKKTVPDSSE